MGLGGSVVEFQELFRFFPFLQWLGKQFAFECVTRRCCIFVSGDWHGIKVGLEHMERGRTIRISLNILVHAFPIIDYTCACWISAECLLLPPLLYLYLDCLTRSNIPFVCSLFSSPFRYFYFVYLYRFFFTGTFPFFQVLFQHFPFFQALSPGSCGLK